MNCNSNFLEILTNCYPDAYADICGGNDYPNICGRAYFYQFSVCGTLVKVEVGNLPLPSDSYFSAFYGMHIHENGNCTPPFDKTGDHFNPGSKPHPMHAGDMPALLGNKGYSISIFYTERFIVDEILGRSIIINRMPDDYMTQPSGNSGEKIACGVIQRFLP